MSECSLLRYGYLAYFSQPAGERVLYKTLRNAKCHSVVELGIGMTTRTQRLFEVLRRYGDGQAMRYTGIDLFEARTSAAPGLKLKAAFQALQNLGTKPQLVPGDPYSALSRVANTLPGTDLLIVSADQDAASLARAWFYVPRMLHPASLVFVERPGADGKSSTFERLTVDAVAQLAAAQAKEARRAA